MPHVIIEYTNNLENAIDFKILFSKFHQIIVDILPVDINLCRSRAVSRQKYFIGNGDEKNAHLHVNISVLEGHNEEILQNLGCLLMSYLKEQCKTLKEDLRLQTTCEIKEINKNLYFK